MDGRVDFEEAVAAARCGALEDDDVAGAPRGRRDTTLWKAGDEAHQRIIADSLGWLDVAAGGARRSSHGLGEFVDERARRGLPPRGAARHGRLQPRAGGHVLRLRPGAGLPRPDRARHHRPGRHRRRRRRASTSRRTLFIVASKSGGTTETASLHAYFYERLHELDGASDAGRHFVAITDEGTSLEQQALEQDFRAVFVNPPRHRRPLLGALVLRAGAGGAHRRRPRQAARPRAASWPTPAAPSVRGRREPGPRVRRDRSASWPWPAATSSRSSPRRGVGTFGSWVEQLVAESTGKEGRGIFPVDVEPLGPPEVYGDDRAFVYVRLLPGRRRRAGRGGGRARGGRLPGRSASTLDDVYDLGAQFLLWEIAVAVAGARARHRPLRPAQRAGEQGQHAARAGRDGAGRARWRCPPAPAAQAVAFALGDDGLGGGAARPGRAAWRRPPTSPCRPGSRPATTPGTSCRRMRRLLRDARARGHERRLRAALPALHRPVPQGRPRRTALFVQLVSEDGPELPVPGPGRTASAGSSRPRPWATCRRCSPTAAACCASTSATTPVAGLAAFRELLERVLAV